MSNAAQTKSAIQFHWAPPCTQAVYHASVTLALATARLARIRGGK